MKKLVAFITAVAALGCTMTACGKNSDSSSSEKNASASAASTEISTEDSSDNDAASADASGEADTSEAATGKTQQTSTDPDLDTGDVFEVDDADYMEALEDMIDCINDKDFLGYIKYMFPEKILDYAAKANGSSLEALADQLASNMTGDVSEKLPMKIKKVYEVKSDDEDQTEELKEMLEDTMADMDKETGVEELGFDVKEYLSGLSDFHCISVEMENASGDTDTQEFLVYYIKDEGWKFDLSMLTYVKKSKQTSINSAASALYKAANSYLTDMDAKGENISGTFIIGSDDSLNYNVPAGFDTAAFKKGAANYFDNINNLDFFIVCQDGCCVYSVCKQPDGKYTGVYPINYTYGKDGPEPSSDKNPNFDSLYNSCKSNLK